MNATHLSWSRGQKMTSKLQKSEQLKKRKKLKWNSQFFTQDK